MQQAWHRRRASPGRKNRSFRGLVRRFFRPYAVAAPHHTESMASSPRLVWTQEPLVQGIGAAFLPPIRRCGSSPYRKYGVVAAPRLDARTARSGDWCGVSSVHTSLPLLTMQQAWHRRRASPGRKNRSFRGLVRRFFRPYVVAAPHHAASMASSPRLAWTQEPLVQRLGAAFLPPIRRCRLHTSRRCARG